MSLKSLLFCPQSEQLLIAWPDVDTYTGHDHKSFHCFGNPANNWNMEFQFNRFFCDYQNLGCNFLKDNQALIAA